MAKEEKMTKRKVTVDDGFTLMLDLTRFDDWEVMEQLGEAEMNPLKLPGVVKMLLGEKQDAKLRDHCRGADGRVSVERMGEVFAQVLTAAAPNS